MQPIVFPRPCAPQLMVVNAGFACGQAELGLGGAHLQSKLIGIDFDHKHDANALFNVEHVFIVALRGERGGCALLLFSVAV